ncbi:MAG: TauD/TfdA family dioxygenase [Pseudomonadota bacterium]
MPESQEYRSITVKPMAGAIGAEVGGVNLSREQPPAVWDEIHRAFLDHLVIAFRDQSLTPQQQIDLAARFGKPTIYPFIQGLDDAPEVIEILKTEKDQDNFGGSWHSDTTYMEHPALGSVLYAKETPAAGGDTMFANMYCAYESLSDGMRASLDGLHALNSSAQNYRGGRAAKMKKLAGMKNSYKVNSDVLEAVHPVVRTHPVTGRKALYLNGSHTLRFRGMTEEESKPLIDFLAKHAVRPEFTCRLRWEPRTIAIWDNRCAQHYALNDYPGQRRRMHRVTIEGDRPC